MEYDNLYKDCNEYFGIEPDSLLSDHWQALDRRLPVLDLGAGQGRNSFFLAEKGLSVEALDYSPVGTARIKEVAEHHGWPVRAITASFDDFTPQDKYGGILLFGLVQLLTWEQIDLLMQHLKTWTAMEGLVFITAFARSDPTYQRWSRECKPVGAHSFIDLHGNIRTYLEDGQVLDLFNGYEVVHHWEGLGPEHRHDNEPPERHARVEGIFRRNKE